MKHRSHARKTRRSRLVILAAIVIAAAAVIVTVTRLPTPSPPRSPDEGTSLPSKSTSYLGVYESGAPSTYQPVAAFTRLTGRQPNLVGYYSGWGEPFKTSFAETVSGHGAVTMVQMDPTLVPVQKIATGGYDPYLPTFATTVRA